MQELESEVRHTGKLLIDKDRAIAEGKISAHNLLEAQRQMSELEKRNNVLEKVKFCMMQMLMLSMLEQRVWATCACPYVCACTQELAFGSVR